MQAKDIPTLDVLQNIAKHEARWSIGVSVWLINGWTWRPHGPGPDETGEAVWSEKVLRAKLSRMLRSGLVDGCCCGCRGDFVLTDKGRSRLAARDEQHAVKSASDKRAIYLATKAKSNG